jgi:hypothetical protein
MLENHPEHLKKGPALSTSVEELPVSASPSLDSMIPFEFAKELIREEGKKGKNQSGPAGPYRAALEQLFDRTGNRERMTVENAGKDKEFLAGVLVGYEVTQLIDQSKTLTSRLQEGKLSPYLTDFHKTYKPRLDYLSEIRVNYANISGIRQDRREAEPQSDESHRQTINACLDLSARTRDSLIAAHSARPDSPVIFGTAQVLQRSQAALIQTVPGKRRNPSAEEPSKPYTGTAAGQGQKASPGPRR